MGLRTGPTFSAAGVFEGRVNPGVQAQVEGENDLNEDDIKKLNASEALRAVAEAGRVRVAQASAATERLSPTRT
jgi:hypothetical protein